jgi:carbon monoxide dehydrogenase subunit G
VDTSPAPSTPLRNRVRIELEAPPADVWRLVGDLARFPEYSSGLERVEVSRDRVTGSSEYVCHFKAADGEEGVRHRETIRWFEPERGWASTAEEPNAFGLADALTVVTLEPHTRGSRLSWDQHYGGEAVDVMLVEFDHALSDIAQHLIDRFGGRVVERYTAG